MSIPVFSVEIPVLCACSCTNFLVNLFSLSYTAIFNSMSVIYNIVID